MDDMDYMIVTRDNGKERLMNINDGFASWTTDLRSAMHIFDEQTAYDYASMFEATVENWERLC